MRNGIKSKLALCAGLLMAALCAHASFVDASIMIDRAANNKTLNIKYEGARASTVELRIKGVSIQSRKVSADFTAGEQRGVHRFARDVADLRNLHGSSWRHRLWGDDFS